MTEITTKTCSKCNAEQSSENFRKKRGRRDGIGSQCKSCLCIAHAKYRAGNIEKIAASAAKYAATNPEKCALVRVKWRAANPEKCMAQDERHRARSKAELDDLYIKSLLRQPGISPKLIPQSLIELKRAQIQISNFLKEQAK